MSNPCQAQGAASRQPAVVVDRNSADLPPSQPTPSTGLAGRRLSDRTVIYIEINVAQIVRALLVGAAILAAALGTPQVTRYLATADIKITISSAAAAEGRAPSAPTHVSTAKGENRAIRQLFGPKVRSG